MSEEKSEANVININAVPDCIDEPVKELLKPTASEVGSFFSDFVYLLTSGVHLSADKRRLENAYAVKAFEENLKKKIEDKPEDCLVEPRLQVVGQAMEQAKFCIEEPKIRERFENLLVNAADSRYQCEVHPSFSSIVAQMSPLDAENFSLFAKSEQYPIVEYRFWTSEKSYEIAFTNCFVANPEMSTSHELALQAASLNALEKQGLIKIFYDTYITEEKIYESFETTPIMKELKQRELIGNEEEFPKATFQKGAVVITQFGKAFLKVCFNC